jgi:Tol biopolymer transport system component
MVTMRTPKLLAVVACVAGVLAAVQSSSAARGAYPGANGKLLLNAGGRLLLVDPGNAAAQGRRVGAVRDAARPSFSPDGRQIAFDRGRSVWVINVDGSGLRRVSDPSESATQPVFTPDAKAIAYVRSFSSGNGYEIADVVERAVDGGAATVIAPAGGLYNGRPRFSPDGSKLVYSIGMMSGPGGIVVRDLATGKTKSVDPTGSGFNPDWSPDGKQIVWAGPDHGCHACDGYYLWLANADGSHRRKLAGTKGGVASAPNFTPDGRSVLYLHARSDGSQPNLEIVGLDGRARVLIPAGSANAPDSAVFQPR